MSAKCNSSSLLKSVYKEYGFSFSKHTTYGLGGRAEVAYYPQNIGQAVAVFDCLVQSGMNFFVLGNGSNVLASDSGYNGAIISTKKLCGIKRTGVDTFFCLAGTTVNRILKYCVENGFGGLEFLAGIPATCGGLCYMNGGVNGNHIGDVITKVKFYDGKMHSFSNKNCHFGNKYSTMRDIQCLILGVEFKIGHSCGGNVEEKISYYLERRKNLPKGKSCGCVFKNTENSGAGKIIDGCGLKGLNIGKATVSREHANFIINGGNSSADVHKLIKTVQQRVYEKTGLRLEEEVVYIGDFNDSFG